MREPASMERDLEALGRSAESTRHFIRRANVIPGVALEAVTDLELSMWNFQLRWVDDQTPEQRIAMAAVFGAYDELKASVDKLVAEVYRNRPTDPAMGAPAGVTARNPVGTEWRLGGATDPPRDVEG